MYLLITKMLTVFISIKWKKKMVVTLHWNTKQEIKKTSDDVVTLGTVANHQQGTGGSVVEFSPATREARVRFPASAFLFLYRGIKYNENDMKCNKKGCAWMFFLTIEWEKSKSVI